MPSQTEYEVVLQTLTKIENKVDRILNKLKDIEKIENSVASKVNDTQILILQNTRSLNG